MKDDTPVCEEDLHALVDGQLDPGRRAVVEDHLLRQPEQARLVADWRLQRDAVRRAYAELAPGPIPPRLDLLRLAAARLARERRRREVLGWAMAACLCLTVAAGGAGWWLGRFGPPDDRQRTLAVLQSQAMATYRAFSSGADLVEYATDSPQLLTGWVSERFGDTAFAPDLAVAGYRPLGGRLLATEDGGRAGVLVYAGPHGRRLNLLLRPTEPGLSLANADRRDRELNTCVWVDHGLGFALAATLPDEELDSVHELVKRQAVALR